MVNVSYTKGLLENQGHLTHVFPGVCFVQLPKICNLMRAMENQYNWNLWTTGVHWHTLYWHYSHNAWSGVVQYNNFFHFICVYCICSFDNEWWASSATGWKKRLSPPGGPPYSWHFSSPELPLAAWWGSDLAHHQRIQSAVECTQLKGTPAESFQKTDSEEGCFKTC